MSAKPITVQPAGEMTLIGFFKRMSTELDDASRLVLNHLMRGLVERGWLPSIEDLVTGLADRGESAEEARQAITDLCYRRLLDLSEDGNGITTILGTISTGRTPHRGHLESGVNVFTLGGADLLSLNAILVCSVDASTQCGTCQAAISLRMEGEAIVDISPSGVAGFQANWDGESPIGDVGQDSPLFCSDPCLSQWTERHPEIEGLPMSGDLLLHLGAMMGTESGGARFSMFGIEH